MAVYRVHKTSNYTVMSNHHLKNRALSLSAKGLLSVMLSLPDSWEYSIHGLASISKEGDKAVKTALDELRRNGYIVVTKLNPTRGRSRITYQYDVYEEPVEVEYSEKPQVAQAYPSEGVVGEGVLAEALLTGGQVSTNRASTKHKDIQGAPELEGQTTIFDIADEDELPVGSEFSPPTLDEVRVYCEANMLDKCDPELFYDTYAAQGWLLGNGLPMVDWQAAAKKWHRNDRNKAAAARFKGTKAAGDYSQFDQSQFRRLEE